MEKTARKHRARKTRKKVKKKKIEKMDEMLESWQESPHGGHVIGDVIAGEI